MLQGFWYTEVHHSHSWFKNAERDSYTMCSDNTKSSLQSQSKEKLTSGLSWDQLHSELSKNAPTLLSFLQACTKTRVARPNTKAVVGVCAAIILKHRQPKMNLLQKIISLILYAGHASKKVISSNVTINFILVYYLCTMLVHDHVGLRSTAQAKPSNVLPYNLWIKLAVIMMQ